MAEVLVVVGGQFGSEAKGHVTAQLVNKFTEVIPVTNIRVAGPNAGHTVYDQGGDSFAFRQLPVGAVLDHHEHPVTCVIAAGSEIDLEVLFAEIRKVAEYGHYLNLLVDQNATIIQDHHKLAEQDGLMVERLGSTAKGIGAARADRIWRTADRLRDLPDAVRELEAWTDPDGRFQVRVVDTSKYLNHALAQDGAVIVEGTQGYGLGVHTDHYPKSTSSDCRAIDFLAMAGISPWHPGVSGMTAVVVCRVYPIRVAGNSGELRNETTWEALGLPQERTTVTQKVRRVGDWDAELVRDAVQANGGGEFDPMVDHLRRMADPEYGGPSVMVALTMVDQKIPEMYGFEECEDPESCTGHPGMTQEAAVRFKELLEQVEADAGAPVLLATTGPKSAVWI